MHHIFTPHHVQLLNACYPASSALLAAAPNYAPSSHELSRLTYYAWVSRNLLPPPFNLRTAVLIIAAN